MSTDHTSAVPTDTFAERIGQATPLEVRRVANMSDSRGTDDLAPNVPPLLCDGVLTRRAFSLGVIAAGTCAAATGLIGCKSNAGGNVKPETSARGRIPTVFIPHGGGPCFFMDWTMGPADTWERMTQWLRELGREFNHVKAIVVISAHWEETTVTIQTTPQPDLLFDYYGFPPHTYEIEWPAPGSPDLARQISQLLSDRGIATAETPTRGFDHGVFIPLKVAFPDARIPTVQISLKQGLDPQTHIEMGKALAPLRDEGVLIVGSGMSFHNMQAMMAGGGRALAAREFDERLTSVCSEAPEICREQLLRWHTLPHARYCHPREEHLLPLMVIAGAAAGDKGRRIFNDRVMGVEVSAFQFGDG